MQHADGLQLVTRELPGFSDVGLRADTVADGDTLGHLFNVDYFGPGTYEIDASLDVSDFFHVAGTFTVQCSTRSVVLSDGTTADTDLWRIGGSGLDAFAGLNGPADSEDALGLSLKDVEFALAILGEQAGSRSWTSLTAEVGGASFVGLDDVTVSGSNVSVSINTGSDTTVVDYSGSPLSVNTGDGALSIGYSGAAGELVSAAGDVELGIGDFFCVDGSLGFQKSNETVTLVGGDRVDVDLLTVGAAGLDAFAGVNGGTADAVGLSLEDVDFALALAADQADPTRTWTALAASAGSAAFAGIPEVTVSGDTLSVEINRAATDGSLVDYLAHNLTVTTGAGSSLSLAMDGQAGELTRAFGNVELGVGGFFQTAGGFALQKQAVSGLTLSDGSTLNGDLLSLGAADVDAFAGLNGGTADALGLQT